LQKRLLVISEPEKINSVFVLEDLSSIRTSRRGKKMNKWLGSWAFYQQEEFLTYKAEALGKRGVHQDPRYTSQKCNVCKHIKRTNRNKSRFCCKNCGHRTHADLNAARTFRTLNCPINLPSCAFGTLDESETPAAQLLMSHHSSWL